MTKSPHSPQEEPTQSSLFELPLDMPSVPTEPVVALAPVTAATTLNAIGASYADYLRRSEHKEHTITCFLSDLKLFADWVGPNLPVGSLNRDQLGDWLSWLRYDRGPRQPAPKTMARRITFLRNFFHWLAELDAQREDLSEKIALSRPVPPLPELLYDDEVARLVDAARGNSRSRVLLSLLLDAGLKKEEILNLLVSHVDTSDAAQPAIEVHFRDRSRPQRERRLGLPAEFSPAFHEYVETYKVYDHVFDCTERNMNYLLRAIVEKAGLQKRVTLQLLRDVYAVRQLRAGVSSEELREKLGLSPEAWYESSEKYQRLAFPA